MCRPLLKGKLARKRSVQGGFDLSGLIAWSVSCLEPGTVVVVLRVMTDELQDGGKNEIAESERWSSYAVDEDDETSSRTEHFLFT